MRYFYDTEFLEDGTTIELISIGIVSEDGREYYAINSEAPWENIKSHDFLVHNVLQFLPLRNRAVLDEYLKHPPNVLPRPSIDLVGLDTTDTRVKPKFVIANEVRDFITGDYRSGPYKDNELWAYYGAYDHVALCQLWGPMIRLPEGVPMYTNELMQLWETSGRPPKPDNQSEHHALGDAYWNLDLWQRCQARHKDILEP